MSKKDKKQLVEGKRVTSFMVDPDDIVVIGLDTKDGPEHALYDVSINKPLRETTVQNYMLNGVMQDVTCRKNGDLLEVVLGRDRTRHAREAKKRLLKKGIKDFKIPVRVKRYASDLEMRLALRSENYHRRVIDRISMAKDMIADMKLGASDEDLMIAYNLPNVESVKQTLKALDLDKSVQEAIQTGNVSFTEAVKLSGLPREEQKVALKKKTVEKAVRKAAKEAGKMPGKAPSKDYIRAVAAWSHMPKPVRAGILWAIGDLNDDQATVDIVGFGFALEGAKPVRAKPKAEKAEEKAKKAEEKPKKSPKAEKAEATAARSW